MEFFKNFFKKKEIPDKNNLLSLSDVANLLNISKRRLYYWIRIGLLVPYMIVKDKRSGKKGYFFSSRDIFELRILLKFVDNLDYNFPEFRKIFDIWHRISKSGIFSEKEREEALICTEKDNYFVIISNEKIIKFKLLKKNDRKAKDIDFEQ